MHNGAISQTPEALLAKIGELMAQLQAQQRENDGLVHKIRLQQMADDAQGANIALVSADMARIKVEADRLKEENDALRYENDTWKLAQSSTNKCLHKAQERTDALRIKLHWTDEARKANAIRLESTDTEKRGLENENNALRLELDAKSRSLHQAWTKQRESDGQIAGLEAAITDAKKLLLEWDRTNEAQLAELTRLYGIEQQVGVLQGEIEALEREVRALRDWNAATLSPARCECKTCDRRASHQHQ